MSDRLLIRVEVNGRVHERDVPVRMTLADFLRHELGLTGTHIGCEHGVCGACTVLFDDRSARSCLTLAVQADGARVTTVEGLARDGELSVLQRAFIEHHGLQVRVLHTRDAHHPDRVPARPPGPERSRGASGHLRQPVPLHRVYRNRARRTRCCKDPAGARRMTGSVAPSVKMLWEQGA